MSFATKRARVGVTQSETHERRDEIRKLRVEKDVTA